MEIKIKYTIENIIKVDNKFEKLTTDYDDELSWELAEIIAEQKVDLTSGEVEVFEVTDMYGTELN